tara:strand:+ start:517 stop:912 length:396 start_codon:yes stop_codon:yes gene_type:complete
MSMTAKQLHQELQHYYGTEGYHRIHPICNPTNSAFTDGVKAFATKAQAYWFLDIVFSELITDKKTKDETFLDILLSVGKKGLSGLENEAWIIVTDGNEKELYKKVIKYTDCPDGDWNFFFTGSVLMLPSEY